jgi:hypothetical protein
MDKSREATRNVVQELMNEVIEQGFHELVNRPQESSRLNELLQSAGKSLGEQLYRIDHHEFEPGSPELHQHWESITNESQHVSFEFLRQIQQIRQQYNPRLKRI